MKFLRAGRYGRIVGAMREAEQRVRLTQTYKGCACADQQVRKAGTGHRFPPRCEEHGNPWFMVRTDPLEEDE
jgi:hypothetical protein